MNKVAGLLFFIAGSLILMGIITAEIFFTANYSISLDMISTLGSSPPPDSIVREPSAAIFDSSMIISGLLIILGSYFLLKTHKNKYLGFVIFFLGLGALGVGVFPAFHPVAHPIVALIAFLSGGLAAVISFKVTKKPFSYICLILGIIILVFLTLGVLFSDLVVPVLGRGGTERWVAYPTIVWLLGFGSFLMARDKIVSS